MKRDAIARVKPLLGSRKAAWRKNQTVLEWLEGRELPGVGALAA